VKPLLGDEPFFGVGTLLQAVGRTRLPETDRCRTTRHVDYASSNWAGKTT